MPIQYLSDLDDAALLKEYQWSTKRLHGLDRAAPSWAREIRLMYHEYVADEMTARSLSIEATANLTQPVSEGGASVFHQVAGVA
jgi:hypothetical protein